MSEEFVPAPKPQLFGAFVRECEARNACSCGRAIGHAGWLGCYSTWHWDQG